MLGAGADGRRLGGRGIPIAIGVAVAREGAERATPCVFWLDFGAAEVSDGGLCSFWVGGEIGEEENGPGG